MESAPQRIIDQNGYATVARNPITKEGVFPYMGRSIPGSEDPNKVYMVYRPAAELCDPECLASFSGLPITDDHPQLMFSETFGPDNHNLHGTSDNNVSFENGVLYAGIKIFTKTLQGLINAGKKALSAGYRCKFIKSSGVWNGLAYDYVQRNIRGNHISLVKEGRSGPDIAVLDHDDLHMAFDSFDLALESTEEEKNMADNEDKTDKEENSSAKDADTSEKDGDQAAAKDNDADAEEGEKEMTLSEISTVLKTILPTIKEIQDALAGTKSNADASAIDSDDEKDKEGKAMDASEIKNLKNDVAALKSRNPIKETLAQIKGRDSLVRDVTPLVGTFDHADMTTEEVEAYACDKLDIKVPADQRGAALAGFLAGVKKFKGNAIGFAMDSKSDGKSSIAGVKAGGMLDKRLNKSA